MKTFKMLSFIIALPNGTICDLPILDGILINQENVHQSWLLEIYLDNSYKDIFNQSKKLNKKMDVQVVISFPDNEPAYFAVEVLDILPLDTKMSVLMKGTINVLKPKYAEKLLEKLLEEDFSKEELLEKFKKGMKERPRIK